MTYYEFKKIFVRRSSKLSLLILAGLIVLVLYFMLSGTKWVDPEGNTVTGLSAVPKIREAKKEWVGPLTEEKIRRVIEENSRINQTPEAKSDVLLQQEIVYGWKQGFYDIRNLINYSYGKFREIDYYCIDSLIPDQAADFYTNRITNLEEWLADDSDGAAAFSDREKQFLTEQYQKTDMPFLYDYQDGWINLFLWGPTIIMITAMVLGFLCAGIFSDEFRLKASAIFYSSCHGRNKAIIAKLKAGFLTVTAVYWSVMLVYSGITLGIYGADGVQCPIQSVTEGWKSFYNINNGQEYLILMAGGYLGCMFMSALVMLVSAAMKSSLLAVTIPFVLIFLPSFLQGINHPLITKILGVLPDQLLQMNMVIKYFNVYQLGTKVVGAIPVLLAGYFVFTVLLLPLTYGLYKKHQVTG